jgi:LysM repeat protein
MFESFSIPSNLDEWKKKKQKESQKEVEKGLISRRKFLKVFGTAAGAALLGSVLKKGEIAHDLLENDNIVREEENFEEEIFYDGKEPDIEAIRNIFNSKERIEINLETVDKLKDYWKYKYAGDMEGDLVGALKRIKPFIPDLKNIFAKHEVPEKYALLAIPESHWKLDAKSRVGAEGPYQFMPKTGEDYGLMTSEDRRDPLKSANACARFLKDLYNRTQDWNLTLAGYNGGFMGRYLKECKYNKTRPAYDNFLVYLTEKANEIKQEVRAKLFTNHVVNAGETISGICKEYEVSEKTLRKYNKISKNYLVKWQRLKIPLSKKKKSELFQNKIRGIAENLNYPPKFVAVFELVKNTIAWEKEIDSNRAA